jgi:hypothetical protein
MFCGTLVGKHLYNHWTKCHIREDLDPYLFLVLELFACQHTPEVLEVLKEITMKMIVFESDITQPFYPENEGSRILRNNGKFLPDYIISLPEGIHLQILHFFKNHKMVAVPRIFTCISAKYQNF